MAETTRDQQNRMTPSNALIGMLWAQLQTLETTRHACRMRSDPVPTPELDLRMRTLALLLASEPAATWGDLKPKVLLAAMLRTEPEDEPSYQLAMLEAAIAQDTERLQPRDGDPARH